MPVASGPRSFVWAAVGAALGALGSAAVAAPMGPPARAVAGPTVLEEKPEVLVPKQPRSEADCDRLEALTLFSFARLREQRQDYAAALKLYQRAFRYDPASPAIARSIVMLAAQLGRRGEAVRYAMKIADLGDPDPELLRRLGADLTESGEYAGAVALYEKALAARPEQKDSPLDTLLRMEMGRLYHLLEKYDKAAGQFAKVLEALDNPGRSPIEGRIRKIILNEPGATYNLIGDCFLRAGRPADALAAFNKANQAAPNSGLLAFHLAQVEFRTGKPQQAFDKLAGYFAARLSSEGTSPYRLLADILKALGKEGELVGRLEKLRAADPTNVPLGYYLADRYRDAGQLDKAEPLYREMTANAPTIAGYRALVEVYRKAKRNDALLALLGEAVEKTGSLETLTEKDRPLSGDDVLVQALIGLARTRIKGDLKTFPYGQRLAAGMLALDAKRFDDADKLLDLAVQAKPEQAAELLLTWGLGLVTKEQPARAVPVFRRGTDEKLVRENRHVFYFYLAGALEMAGKTDEALVAGRQAAAMVEARDAAKAETANIRKRAKAIEAELRKAQTDLPEIDVRKLATIQAEREAARKEAPRYQSRVAWILYHAKRNDEAAKIYTDLVRKYESNDAPAEVRQVLRDARLALSNLAVLKNDMPGAIEWLEQVLDEFPDDPSGLNDLGYLWADQGKHLLRAERMIRKALEEEPDNAAYRDSLGWVLFRLGRTGEAVVELEKAAAKEPDPSVLDHLGDAYLQAGKKEKARQSWRRAVEAFEKAGEPDKVKPIEQKIATP